MVRQVDNQQAKSIRKRIVIIGSSLAFVLLLLNFTSFTQVLQMDATILVATNRVIPSSITTSEALANIAREHAQSEIGMWGRAEVSNVEALFACIGLDCNLQQLIITITVYPIFPIPSFDVAFSRTEYGFNLQENSMNATTYISGYTSTPYIAYPSDWRSVEISMEEAANIVINNVETCLTEPFETYETSIIWHHYISNLSSRVAVCSQLIEIIVDQHRGEIID